jgi:DNA-binding LacI/PurR family transcriptional regulator
MQFSRANLTEFASRLGLSARTVSRVLAGKGDAYRIASKTQERVLAAARESGFVINQIARGLRIQRTNTIGIVVPDIGNPFFAALAHLYLAIVWSL